MRKSEERRARGVRRVKELRRGGERKGWEGEVKEGEVKGCEGRRGKGV
jgi:hypothetical protein